MRTLYADLLDGLRADPWRSLGAVLALSLSAAAVCVLIALQAGAERETRRAFGALGRDGLVLRAGPIDARDPDARLSTRHVALVSATLGGAPVAPVRVVPLPDDPHATRLVFSDQGLAVVRGWQARDGRLLDAHDVASARRVAVISAALARRATLAPGAVLRSEEMVLEVVGVFEGTLDGPTGAGDEALIAVPWTLERAWVANLPTLDTPVDALMARTPDPELGARRALAVLAQPGSRAGQVEAITPAALLGAARQLDAALRAGLIGSALLTLILGAGHLTSVLGAAVRERAAEIALRRALGGRRDEVARLFVVEGAVLGGVAALAGAGLGITLIINLPALEPRLVLALTPIAVLAPLSAGPVLGALCAAWPAARAATLEPALALRAEGAPIAP